jgi:hypothetical protein
VAQQAFEPERQVEEPLLTLAGVAQLPQPRLHLERLLEREVLPLLRLGVELRDAVGLGEREVEDAPDVLDGRLALGEPNVMICATRSAPYFSRT